MRHIRAAAKRLDDHGTRRPGSWVLFTICMLATITIGWGNDYGSCARSNGIRQAQRIFYSGVEQRALVRARVDTGVVRAADIASYHSAAQTIVALHQLDCTSLFPAN